MVRQWIHLLSSGKSPEKEHFVLISHLLCPRALCSGLPYKSATLFVIHSWKYNS